MKIGVFCHINGNLQRLENVFHALDAEKVNRIFCLGNLISPLERIETDTIGNDGVVLDKNSIKCWDLFKRYEEYLENLRGKKQTENSIYAFRGKNELDFLLREESRNRTNSRFYNEILNHWDVRMDLVGKKDSRIYIFNTDPENIDEHLTVHRVMTLDETINKKDEAVEREKIKDYVCFFGGCNSQSIYEVDGKGFVHIFKRDVQLCPGRSYIISPSPKDGGYAIFDGYSISLYSL
ncbi:hypothetical protein HYX18_03990 [Candidatus Woesearchaeota archaeon]|nr:hypothetical protein [Candidatus Woesearchaeota archaeon]